MIIRQCNNCNQKSFRFLKLFALSWGSKVRCSHCKKRFKTSFIAQVIMMFLNPFTLIAMIAILTHYFGFIGFIGFIATFLLLIPVETVIGMFLPLEIVEEENN